MSEEQKHDQPICGWIKPWHPSGIQVTLPVPFGSYASMFAAVSDAIATGFTASAPGLEQGEEQAEVGYVCRVHKSGERGASDLLFLYSPNDAWTWKFLYVYINNDEQALAFEEASGLKAASLPEYPSEAAPQRGKAADKYIIKSPRPFGVVFRENPKYDENETDVAKKKSNGPKHKFVRWVNQKSPTSEPTSNGTTHEPESVDTTYTGRIESLHARLMADPAPDELSGLAAGIDDWPDGPRAVAKKMINDFRRQAGLSWDKQGRRFYRREAARS